MEILLFSNENIYLHSDRFYDIFDVDIDVYTDSLPHIQGKGCVYFLSLEIRKWLCSYKVSYDIFERKISSGFANWYIDISDDKIATLFKLTWC